MGNTNQIQFQPKNNNKRHSALQGNNIAKNEAIPNGEAQIIHPLPTQMMNRSS